MSQPTIIIRHLCFTGNNKPPAIIEFSRGLNILYGASETGKSFVLEAIDFMTGGGDALRDIPERVGYDRVLLGMETENNEQFTIVRAASGGDFQLFSGLLQSLPTNAQGTRLAAKHNADNLDNLSGYLLDKIGLQGKKLKKNVRRELRNLTFRDLAHLCIIDEGRIQQKESPIEGGQYIQKTAEYSVFKLLLTGSDDSSFIPETVQSNRSPDHSKIELLDEILVGYKAKLPDNNNTEEDYSVQLQMLSQNISREQTQLTVSESEYRELIISRNNLRHRIEEGQTRRGEIDELTARFYLLNSHYESDLARLEGIREAGSLIVALEKKTCPLCGASPDHQHPGEDSDGNLEVVVSAAIKEGDKIKRLQVELSDTLRQLRNEAGNFDQAIPTLERSLARVEAQVQELSSRLLAQRTDYTQLIEVRSEIQGILSLFAQVNDLTNKRNSLLEVKREPEGDSTPRQSQIVELSSSILDEFAQQVEKILKDWNFPDSDRVQFNEGDRDFVISGKRRGSRGKGMRSITHAAFIIGILEYCKAKNNPHPGFVVLDSPLLAYREPEDSDDDLSHTDVQDKFYEYLSKWTDRQVIVMENITPPAAATSHSNSVMFSKNSNQDRYGFFPMIGAN